MSSELSTPSDTRSALLAAGRALLLEAEAFSMGAVARRAGVSRQAVYLHFEDRYGLLEAVVEDALADGTAQRVREAVEATVGADDALAAYVAATTMLAARHGALQQAVRRVLAADPTLSARWEARTGRRSVHRAVVARLEAAGRLRSDLTPAEAEAALWNLVSVELMLPLCASLGEERTAELLRRAIAAALLDAPYLPEPSRRC
ncbi:MAG: TetR/AcrR family transcriptional regulator [Alphaproteobacteria bacterium]|nr:TetR/AcrR family transcriptional regulator [Alphaproteobacteria bacterium]